MAFTANASKANQIKIQKLLCMRNPYIISQSPNRPNITQYVEKVGPDVCCLDWLIGMLDNDGQECMKVIIYCRTFRECAEVYRHFESCFGGNSCQLDQRLYEMVHSRTPDDVKLHVQDAIQFETSKLRVLIATKIIGMGLDLSVDMVVHYGLPSTIEAVILYSGKQLRNVEVDMISYVPSKVEIVSVRKC